MASQIHFCSNRCIKFMIPLSLCPEADVIVDPHPMTGAFNMAMDSTLLDLAAHRDRTVLRIYRWQEPTVTLGYFQAASLSDDIPFPGLPVVRRLSGGGAILHHRELTYSCILPDSHPVRDEPSTLYSIIHLALIQLLAECGAPATLRSQVPAHLPIARQKNTFAQSISTAPPTPTAIVAEPFLCFLRSNPNDIVHCSGPKITGSAQRRRRGAILQHGSILLEASPHAPQIPGLKDLNPAFLLNDFQTLLPSRVAQAVSSNWSLRNYSEQELHLTSQSMQTSATL
jgi:lipoate-protein ligase A